MGTAATKNLGPGRYDFNLTAAQEERAARLHCESIVFDWLSQHVGGRRGHHPAEIAALVRRQVDAAAVR